MLIEEFFIPWNVSSNFTSAILLLYASLSSSNSSKFLILIELAISLSKFSEYSDSIAPYAFKDPSILLKIFVKLLLISLFLDSNSSLLSEFKNFSEFLSKLFLIKSLVAKFKIFFISSYLGEISFKIYFSKNIFTLSGILKLFKCKL